jgi:hypothetical protein
MDSAGPIEGRTAGQPTVSTGTTTFALFGDRTEAETGFGFAFDWLGRDAPRPPYRGPHHPPATGDRHAA